MGPWRRFKFSVSQRASKLSFKAFSSTLTQTVVESCVDLEVALLSVLMVQRLPHPEIPVLNSSVQHVTEEELC